jgi:hypothetical protein
LPSNSPFYIAAGHTLIIPPAELSGNKIPQKYAFFIGIANLETAAKLLRMKQQHRHFGFRARRKRLPGRRACDNGGMEENMDAKKKLDEGHAGESDLFKAVKLLEENGFYVVHADFGSP